DPALRELERELALRREVQVRVQDQALAEEAELGRLRLLHLHDHVRGPSLGCAVDEQRARARVQIIGDAAPEARAVLHAHLVPSRDELPHAGGRHPHAVLARLDLLWNADSHPAIMNGRALPLNESNPGAPW